MVGSPYLAFFPNIHKIKIVWRVGDKGNEDHLYKGRNGRCMRFQMTKMDQEVHSTEQMVTQLIRKGESVMKQRQSRANTGLWICSFSLGYLTTSC